MCSAAVSVWVEEQESGSWHCQAEARAAVLPDLSAMSLRANPEADV